MFSFIRLPLLKWQGKDKRRASAGGVFHPQPSAMGFNNPFGDGQPKSGAAFVAVVERLHHVRLDIRRDARPVIDDFQEN
jgi:hypothetical protein